jgi:hypothetical protein
MIILEKEKHLLLRSQNGLGKSKEIQAAEGIVWIGDEQGRAFGFDELRDERGGVKALNYLVDQFMRLDAGTDPSHFYHVKPLQPVTELREKALRLSPPIEPGPFRKPDLVELVALDPAIHRHSICHCQQFLEHPGVHGGASVSTGAGGGSAGSRAAQVAAARIWAVNSRRLPAVVCHEDILGCDAREGENLCG